MSGTLIVANEPGVRGGCSVCGGELRQLGHDMDKAWAACKMCGTAYVAHVGSMAEMYQPELVNRVRDLLRDPNNFRLNCGQLEECVFRPDHRQGDSR